MISRCFRCGTEVDYRTGSKTSKGWWMCLNRDSCRMRYELKAALAQREMAKGQM